MKTNMRFWLKKNIYFAIYMLFFFLQLYTPVKPGIIAKALLLWSVVLCLFGSDECEMVLFSSFIVKGEIYAIITALVALFFIYYKRGKYSFSLKKPSSAVMGGAVTILLYGTFLSMINGRVINAILQLVYICLLLVFALYVSRCVTVKRVMELIHYFIVMEFLCDILIALKIRSIKPGDAFCGTMESAHWLGNWCMAALIALVVYSYHINGNKIIKAIKSESLYIVMGVVVFILASAKALLVSAVIGLLLYAIVSWIYKVNSFCITFLLVYTLMFIIMSVIYRPSVKLFLSQKSNIAATYFYTDGWNIKLDYYRGTFLEELRGGKLLFGHGLGCYGSRVSNALAYTETWRNNNGFNRLVSTWFKPSYIENYVKYIRPYNKDVVIRINERSAVLTYPFNSITALIGETGILGVGLIGVLLQKKIRYSYARAVSFYFLFACVFDTYFDMFQCIGWIVLLVLNVVNIKDASIKTCSQDYALCYNEA